jgi:hypothetical protein
MSIRIIVLMLLFGVTSAVNASAQSSVSVRGYAVYDGTSFSAVDSLEAVSGSSTHSSFGGGGTVNGLWRAVFVDVGVFQSRVDGERIFVDGGTTYRLGIPLEITVRPIDVAAGWRFTTGRFSPYVGGGLTSLSYEESSAFSQLGDNITERKTGGLFLVGMDARVYKWFHVGGELRYRAVKGVLGNEGVSQTFGEDQVGGLSAGLRVSLGK